MDAALSTERPTVGETEIREWNAKDSLARNLIIQSVSNEILPYIRKEKTAAKLMKASELLFVENGPQNQILLFNIKPKYGENVDGHVAKMFYRFD